MVNTIFLDDDELWFPSPIYADGDGLLALGGDLSTDRLWMAYSNGIFPWYPYDDNDLIMWYCPLERFVIFPKDIHISHSMRTLINKHRYRVTWDKDFEGVIQGCATAQERNKGLGAWLGPDMIEAYTRLHREGIAHSVEVWDGDRLVGGLYGERVGNAFCGESMFSLVPSASKLALICLARKMEAEGVALIDCQFETPHLKSMGGTYIPYNDYMRLLTGQHDVDFI
ncbi:MAG: leucyl/phenylalanyl-tRNA--protein transferase [Bacteroidales bacterium]|nr:leucyl/phenylalanyl-tRNA--protein transferase [Bacteroidales bacterium]